MRLVREYVMAPPVFIVLLIGLLIGVWSAWPQPMPKVPLYPGAQEVTQTSTKEVLLRLSFTSTDSPDAIKQFYIKELTAQGWNYTECDDFIQPGNFRVATVSALSKIDGKTHVTIEATWGMMSCDKKQ